MELRKHSLIAALGMFLSATTIFAQNTFPSSGNVGIGTTTPISALQVNGVITSNTGSYTKYSGYFMSMAPVADGTYSGYLLLSQAYTSGTVADSEIQGRVTLSRGATSAGNRTDVLEVSAKSAYQTGYFIVNSLASFNGYVTGLFQVTYNGVNYYAIGLTQTGGDSNNGAIFDGLTINATPQIVTSTQVSNVTSYGELGFVVSNTGVGIGTTSPAYTFDVAGKIHSSSGGVVYPDGTTQTTAWTGVVCGGDYAESVDVTGDRKRFSPGDVLVVDQDSPGKFLKSGESYSTAVTGIYSTKPGTVGRRQKTPYNPDEVPMAMMGIVPVKATAENGPIRPGDLLVSSSTIGYAMKGTDRSRMLGAVIGKALGKLDSDTGVIEVVVTLQ